MREESDKVLGIDLGGTKILTSVIDSEGKMLSRDHSVTPAAQGHEAVIQAIVESIRRTLDEAHLSPGNLEAIGIAAPGLSNPQAGVIYTSPNLPGWQNVPLRDIISEEIGKATYLINDGSAAALGEWHYGAGKGTRDLVYVTISTGVGGGIIIDGRIYAGATGTAGELGHMVIDHSGPLCNCGNTGCWEILASGTALATEAKHLIGTGTETAILAYAGGSIEKINAEAIQGAALAGDELANKLIARNAYYHGVGLANLINIFNPEIIVIGGGLSNMGDMLLLPAYEEAERRAFKESFRAVRFELAKLGRNSGVIGAAAFAREQANCRLR
jgi:glucokinase